MNCPQCQTPNQLNSAFCSSCGTQLVSAEAPAAAGGYPPPGQGTPVGYGAPSGYGQASPAGGGYGPAGQYQPASQYPPQGQYPPPSQQAPGGFPQPGGQYQPRPAGSGGPASTFQFDLKRLTRTDQIVGVASLVVLISIFLPWFTASADGFSASGSGTAAHGWLWLVFVLDLAIIAYLVMRAGWEESPLHLPVAHAPLLLAATGLQLLLVVIAFFDMPSSAFGVSIGWAWGAFIGLLAALAAAAPVVVPAVRSYMESRR